MAETKSAEDLGSTIALCSLKKQYRVGEDVFKISLNGNGCFSDYDLLERLLKDNHLYMVEIEKKSRYAEEKFVKRLEYVYGLEIDTKFLISKDESTRTLIEGITVSPVSPEMERYVRMVHQKKIGTANCEYEGAIWKIHENRNKDLVRICKNTDTDAVVTHLTNAVIEHFNLEFK